MDDEKGIEGPSSWSVEMTLDVEGLDLERIRCNSCSGRYCGRRNVRIVNGRHLAVCNLKLQGEKSPPLHT